VPHYRLSEPAEVTLSALTTALNLVGIGILLLDHDLRVRFLNRRYAEIFSTPPALLTGGPTYQDLVEAGAGSAVVVPADELSKFIKERVEAVRSGSISPTQVNLRDGRRVLLSCAACPDGGRILTYVDISGELDREATTAVELATAEMRFRTEMLEAQGAYLASMAESIDENARGIEAERQELEQKIVEHRGREAELRRLAAIDGLTGALNRGEFLASAQREIDAGLDVAVLMLDVDHFKHINDRFGHAAGDAALRHLVATLRKDTRQVDLLGRLGGEEFAVLMPAVSRHAAENTAERLRSRIAKTPLAYSDHLIEMTVSVGVALRQISDRTIDQLTARADAALYQAKGAGRNRVICDDRLLGAA
jgi:diguanylate cyclase (GGDEF)-like protein